jgi:two-component system chemotaxis response regulator CheB
MSTTITARVVVADDSAMMRAIVTNSLKLAGVEVVGSAANGDEALALCERFRPDAMTLDLAMPGRRRGADPPARRRRSSRPDLS